ncbi:MAG: hypothetical protein P8M04_08895 [Akkermansiaceae bacterium]|nr:hypothetical protein [Akkermansiaceae bacterium]
MKKASSNIIGIKSEETRNNYGEKNVKKALIKENRWGVLTHFTNANSRVN